MAEVDDTDALRRLQERLDRAAEAAERLLAEAVTTAAGGDETPAQDGAGEATPSKGWQRVEPEEQGGERRPWWSSAETDALLAVVASLRDHIPPELQRRLVEAAREVLMAVRALVDWCLERMERRRAQPAQVQDIPIL